MKRLSLKFWLVLLVLAALMMPMAVVSAQGPGSGDKVIFGSNYTLSSGERLDGNLLVLGGNVTLQEDSTVTGDVTVLGGSVEISGSVEGDVAMLGGSLHLTSTAVVEGDVSSIGGSLDRDPGAEIQGDSISGFEFGQDGGVITIPGIPRFEFGAPGQMPNIEIEPPPPGRDGFAGWLAYSFIRGFSAIALAALMAILGVLLVVLAPRATERVTQTTRENAAVSFGVGCVTQVLAIPVFVLLAITICLIPLALIGMLALIAGWVFGWLALGWLVGQKLLQMIKSPNAAGRSSSILEIVVGVVALTLAWQLPSILPCIGWLIAGLVGIIAGSIGLGAVLLTRFGTRPYTPGGGRGGSAPVLPPPGPAYSQPTFGAPIGALPEPGTPEQPSPSPDR